jgi:hypothetical protein
MRNYYYRLILCGCMIATFFYTTPLYLHLAWWALVLMLWLGTCAACTTLWIFVVAYQRLPKTTSPVSMIFDRLRRYVTRPPLLFFSGGFLAAILAVSALQDEYETSYFDALATKVLSGRPYAEDSVLIRSLNISHKLLAERTVIYGNQRETSWIGRTLHPLSSDLIAANGACGSYANVLCRLLQVLRIKARLLQMQDATGQAVTYWWKHGHPKDG